MKHITIIVVALLSLVIGYPISQAKAAPILTRNAVTTSKVAVAVVTTAKVEAAAPQPVAPAPTPPPAPTPAPLPVYAATGTCTTYASLFAQYAWPVQTALAICQAESGGNPNSVSNAGINYDHVSDFGLMQLHGLDILDPAENVAYAYYHKYVPSGGFGPWSTYTSGKYRQYLR